MLIFRRFAPIRVASFPLTVLLVAQAWLAAPSAAQTRPSRPVATAAASAPAPASSSASPPASNATVSPTVSATPQQTTASFADWTLRCSRLGPAPGTQFCEVAQGIQREDRPVAQMAIGRPAKGQPLQLTVLVPANASFASQPALLAAKEEDGPAIELSWRRCLPGGCTADAALPEETLHRMRGWTEPARIGFLDAAGRAAVLPFSPRGLPQALDALAKEDGG